VDGSVNRARCRDETAFTTQLIWAKELLKKGKYQEAEGHYSRVHQHMTI
jgi:hypothetical protein